MPSSETTSKRLHSSGELGTYCLILHLAKRQRIAIGRNKTFGTFAFKQGWHAYIGSAFGSGGVRARTNRHKRFIGDRKSSHWHVDYFREKADIVEIIYTFDTPEREHHFTDALLQMPGATVPVPRFGSLDCDQCPAHLVYFPSQPSSAVFRSILHSGHEDHEPVFVEFAKPLQRRVIKSDELYASYLRGRRSLEARRATEGIEWPGGDLRQGQRAQKLVAEVAGEMKVDPASLVEDDIFAFAVDKIVKYTGATGLDVLFDEDRPQTRDHIMKLGRKSREWRMHRIEQVASGKSRSVKPVSTRTVPDTMDFPKILSRLARARGFVAHGRTLVEGAGSRRLSKEKKADICITVKQYLQATRQHLAQIVKVEGRSGDDVTRTTKAKDSTSKLTLAELPWRMKSGLGLIQKNVRDFPRTSYDIRPTENQRDRAQAEISRIEDDCNGILAALDKEAKP